MNIPSETWAVAVKPRSHSHVAALQGVNKAPCVHEQGFSEEVTSL